MGLLLIWASLINTEPMGGQMGEEISLLTPPPRGQAKCRAVLQAALAAGVK